MYLLVFSVNIKIKGRRVPSSENKKISMNYSYFLNLRVIGTEIRKVSLGKSQLSDGMTERLISMCHCRSEKMFL